VAGFQLEYLLVLYDNAMSSVVILVFVAVLPQASGMIQVLKTLEEVWKNIILGMLNY
jgi:hypothetical protein